MGDFTHFDESGKAVMVDVSGKGETERVAVAGGRVELSEETARLIASGGMKKGDVLSVARLAGIMGAKRTPDLIPLCHPLSLSSVKVELSLDEAASAVDIKATCKLIGLDPYRYIRMLYEELPKPSAKQNIDRLLPDRYLAENPDAKIVAR